MKLIKNIILMISLIAFLVQIYIDFNPNMGLSIEKRTCIVLIQVLGFYSVYYYQIKINNQKKEYYFRRLIWVLFIIYIFNLGYLLFLDGELGRDFHFIYNEDIQGINFIPFQTIKLYINSYHGNYLPLSIIGINLIGNLFAFMPFGVFLPILFKKQRKWYVFFITVSLIIIGVEILQIYSASGSGDIDDYILNITGSMFMFFVSYIIRKVRRL